MAGVGLQRWCLVSGTWLRFPWLPCGSLLGLQCPKWHLHSCEWCLGGDGGGSWGWPHSLCMWLGWDSLQLSGLRLVGIHTLRLASHRACAARAHGRRGKALRRHAVSLLLHFLGYPGPTMIHCWKGPNEGVILRSGGSSWEEASLETGYHNC